MLNEIIDIEELITTDSVGEANRLLQEGWELLGFHPAPATTNNPSVASATVFVLARLTEYDDEEDLDIELEEFEPQRS